MYRNKILDSSELDVLKYLREVYSPDAIIAGGAVRDMVLGKPYKDIDIWFNKVKMDVAQRFFEILLPKDLGFRVGKDCVDIPLNFRSEMPQTRGTLEDRLFGRAPRQPVVVELPEPDEWADNSADIFKNPEAPRRVEWMLSVHYKDAHYQLMHVNVAPIDFVSAEFDIGLCKIWHDGDKVTETEGFKVDRENKTFTIDGIHLGQKNFDWAVNKHLPRLKILYPDFKANVISIPEVKKKTAGKKVVFTSTTLGVDEVRRTNHPMNPLPGGEVFEVRNQNGRGWRVVTQWEMDNTLLPNGTRRRRENNIETAQRMAREAEAEAEARRRAQATATRPARNDFMAVVDALEPTR